MKILAPLSLAITLLLLAGCSDVASTSESTVITSAVASASTDQTVSSTSSAPVSSKSSASNMPSYSTNSASSNTKNTSQVLLSVSSVVATANDEKIAQKYQINGDVLDSLNENIIVKKGTSLFVASLKDGTDLAVFSPQNVTVPSGYSLDEVIDAAILGSSVLIEYTAKQGADKYNNGSSGYAYVLFDIKNNKQIGKTVISQTKLTSPTTELSSDISWYAGVPGKSSVLASSKQDGVTDGENAKGNIAIFADGQEPLIQSISKNDLTKYHGLVNGKLEIIADGKNRSTNIGSVQVTADKYLVNAGSQTYLVPAESVSSPEAGVKFDLLLGRSSLAQSEYTTGYYCGDSEIAYQLQTGNKVGPQDIKCKLVSPSGNILGYKGDKQLPVIVNQSGNTIDVPQTIQIKSIKFISDHFIIGANIVYEYSN